jgi:hypothetical protein
VRIGKSITLQTISVGTLEIPGIAFYLIGDSADNLGSGFWRSFVKVSPGYQGFINGNCRGGQ